MGECAAGGLGSRSAFAAPRPGLRSWTERCLVLTEDCTASHLYRSDLEYMELDMLQRGLGADMPPLLLNKFLHLGRRRARSAGSGGGAAASGLQPDADIKEPDQ